MLQLKGTSFEGVKNLMGWTEIDKYEIDKYLIYKLMQQKNAFSKLPRQSSTMLAKRTMQSTI